MKKILKNIAKNYGYQISKIKQKELTFPIEFSNKDIEIFKYVKEKKLTMISDRRMIENIQIAKFISLNNIKGDFVECGVWRGGSALLVKMIFESYNNNSKVWLFDTFKGMTKPTNQDIDINGNPAIDFYKQNDNFDFNQWCYASIEEVKYNFKVSGVKIENCNFIEGDVLDTIPKVITQLKNICFLRLDTDWYQSTKLELEYLYPKIIKNGFLVIDDYGYWKGSKKATDEYFTKNKIKKYFSIIDNESRMIRI